MRIHTQIPAHCLILPIILTTLFVLVLVIPLARPACQTVAYTKW